MLLSMQSPLSSFGENIRQLRMSRGLSQEELADEAGLHRTYIGSVERGERNVSLLNIIKLAEALQVTPSQLLEGLTSSGASRKKG